jgi:hypothetical protein
MSKIGLHDPFEHPKHKLWPKEGAGVKLAIWLLTIKSQESPWFPCIQVACDIPLESSWQGLQLFFRLHFNRRFACKVMGSQSWWSPNWEFGCGPRGEAHSILKRGRWWFPSSLNHGESCESKFARGSS